MGVWWEKRIYFVTSGQSNFGLDFYEKFMKIDAKLRLQEKKNLQFEKKTSEKLSSLTQELILKFFCWNL